MAAAGGLIRKMSDFLLKYAVVLMLFQVIITANGHGLESESVLKRERRALPTEAPKTTVPNSSYSMKENGTGSPPSDTTKAPGPPMTVKTTTTTSKSATTTAVSNVTNNVKPAKKSEVGGGDGKTTPAGATTAGPTTVSSTPKGTTGTAVSVTTKSSSKTTTTAGPSPKPTGTVKTTTTAKPGSTTTPKPTLKPYQDDKIYYTQSLYNTSDDFETYWVDIEKDPSVNSTFNITELEDVVRTKARSLMLPWPFLYYGHKLKNVTLAAGGFIHMNPLTPYSFLTLSGNISPFMSDLTTSSTNRSESGIFKVHNDSIAIFEWREMRHFDKADLTGIKPAATFTFQVHLLNDGEIRFVYKKHPTPVANISQDLHDVKAGIADGFTYNDRMNEYHEIDVSSYLGDEVVITFTPKETCIKQNSCESCAKVKDFECVWCNELKRCSDGMDRHRETWLKSSCKDINTIDCSTYVPTAPPTKLPPSKSTTVITPTTTTKATTTTIKATTTTTKRPKPNPTIKPSCVKDKNGKCKHEVPAPSKSGPNIGAIVGVFLVIFIVLGVGVWFWYAYKHPTSSSGMCLITTKTSCCRKGRISRSSKDYQAFMESDTESLPL